MSKQAKTLNADEAKAAISALQSSEIPHKAKIIAAVKRDQWIQNLIDKKQITKAKILGLFGYVTEKWWGKKKARKKLNKCKKKPFCPINKS